MVNQGVFFWLGSFSLKESHTIFGDLFGIPKAPNAPQPPQKSPPLPVLVNYQPAMAGNFPP